jgi:protein TonB
MNVATNWSIYQRRETAAQLGTVMIGLFILVLSQTMAMHQEVPVQENPISLTIMAQPVAPDQIIEQPVQTIQPPKPEKIVESPKKVIPVTDVSAPAQARIAAPVSPVLPKENIELTNATPQVQRSSNSAAEGLFAQDVRARIERKKIYPDTARDLGMSGEVEVLYELDRSGNLIRAEIVSSSGYKLLDQAALKAVKSAFYKSFPEDAWVGASSKVFRTKLVFSINQ